MPRHLLVLIFIAIVAASLLAFIWFLGQERQSSGPGEEAPTQEESIPRPAPSTIYRLAGEITELGSGFFVFSATVDGSVEERGVRVSAATQVVRRGIVTDEVTGERRPQDEPFPYGDLRVGDQIEVMSARHVLTQDPIEATRVRFIRR